MKSGRAFLSTLSFEWHGRIDAILETHLALISNSDSGRATRTTMTERLESKQSQCQAENSHI